MVLASIIFAVVASTSQGLTQSDVDIIRMSESEAKIALVRKTEECKILMSTLTERTERLTSEINEHTAYIKKTTEKMTTYAKAIKEAACQIKEKDVLIDSLCASISKMAKKKGIDPSVYLDAESLKAYNEHVKNRTR